MKLSDELQRPSEALTAPVKESEVKRTKVRQKLVRVHHSARKE